MAPLMLSTSIANDPRHLHVCISSELLLRKASLGPISTQTISPDIGIPQMILYHTSILGWKWLQVWLSLLFDPLNSISYCIFTIRSIIWINSPYFFENIFYHVAGGIRLYRCLFPKFSSDMKKNLVQWEECMRLVAVSFVIYVPHNCILKMFITCDLILEMSFKVVIPQEPGELCLFDGILPKVPYSPCLRMADRALLTGYPRFVWCNQFMFVLLLSTQSTRLSS